MPIPKKAQRELDLPDDLDHESSKKSQPRTKPKTRKKPAKRSPSAAKTEDTKYRASKQLPGMDPEGVKASKKSKHAGLSLEEIRKYSSSVDFDVNNLQGEADAFLGHLRKPLDKAEIRRLHAERKRLQLQREKEFNENFPESESDEE